jgi:glycosyltransferase involved in cell wall biosynthesis
MNICDSKPLISVVVPVYKVEKYLRPCIDSILAQTFTDFECILIDDGSPDNCPVICDNYAEKDKRIVVIHNKNGGVTSARAAGVQKSIGEYICFVDSDDTLPKDALSLLVDRTKLYDLDILITAYRRIKYKIPSIRRYPLEGVVVSEKYIEVLLLHRCSIVIWARLIKKKLFTEYIFNIPRQIINSEDLIMNLRLGLNAEKIGIFNDLITYNYIYRKGSASNDLRIKYDGLKEDIFGLCKETLIKAQLHHQFKDVLLRSKLLYQFGKNVRLNEENKDELMEIAHSAKRFGKNLDIYEREIISRILYYKYRCFISMYFVIIKVISKIKSAWLRPMHSPKI